MIIKQFEDKFQTLPPKKTKTLQLHAVSSKHNFIVINNIKNYKQRQGNTNVSAQSKPTTIIPS